MITTYNTEYRDDFNTSGVEKKNYLRILFNGGRAVQIRELNQLQSILQSQIDKFGSSVYKDGTAVIGGNCDFDPDIHAITFQFDPSGFVEIDGDIVNVAQLAIEATEGVPLFSQISSMYYYIDGVEESKITADVIDYKYIAPLDGETDYFVTYYVRYSSSGGLNGTNFKLNKFDTDRPVVLVPSIDVFETYGTPYETETVAGIFLSEGVFFTHGSFVVTEKQNVFVSATPEELVDGFSGNIVLDISENIVTNTSDNTLLDNATGTFNDLGLGAHRYQILLNLAFDNDTSLLLDTTSKILLLSIKNNNVVLNSKRIYSNLDRQLAQRTYEESGNYVLNPFNIEIKNLVGSLRPGSLDVDAADRLYVGLDPSVAYVDGYRIETNRKLDLTMNRARIPVEKDVNISALFGNYLDVTIDSGTIPNVNNVNFTYELQDIGDVRLGECRIRAIEKISSYYRVFLYDITLDENKNFLNIAKIDGISFVATVVDTLTVLQDTDLDTSIFPLPYRAVESIITTDSYKFRYSAQKTYTGTVSNPDHIFSISTSGLDYFDDLSPNNFIMTYGGNIVTPIIDVSSTLQSIIIKGFIGNEWGPADIGNDVSVIAKVNKSINDTVFGSKSIITTSDITLVNVAKIVDPITSLEYVLPNTDLIDIQYVEDALGVGEDITASFEVSFDGQTTTKYTNAKIKYIGTDPAPTNINIIYRYYSHTDNLPFVANSYPPNSTKTQFNGYDLRDCVDFRPTILADAAGVVDVTQLDPYSVISCRPNYYLPRVDKVIVTSEGEFKIIEGVPSFDPAPPVTPAASMVLYELSLPAYTEDATDVSISPVDNRRYTMRDIGKLDKRISNVEYYTSLSLLENTVSEKSIFDENGQRFKNGMIIDSFAGHSIGNVFNPAYKCSIDRSTGTVRPIITTRAIDMIVKKDILNDGISYNKNTITLPFDEVELISQLRSSESESVNPYDVASFEGTIELYPSNDKWMETNRRPDIIINDDNAFDNFLAESGADENGVIDTDWGSWEKSWVGKAKTTKTRKKVKGRGIKITTIKSRDRVSTREGVQTVITSSLHTQDLGERIVDISFVPFIRSRRVYFKGRGLKPLTKVYPFFDGINISSYATLLNPVSEEIVTSSDLTQIVEFFGQTPELMDFYDQNLVTSKSGEIQGSFIIPNNNILKFRTGSRVFRLTDSETNATEYNTAADAIYNTSGLLNTVEHNIISTRIPHISKNAVTESIKETITLKTKVKWKDPLAQTFIISNDETDGMFITSLDLWFTAASKTNLPVSIHIVSVENGYPSNRIIPFSEVTLNSEDILLPTEDNTDPKTNFRFSDPVYLMTNTEYAIVVLSNDFKYRIKVARLGGVDENNNVIQTNPYGGVMFTSQNASTWSADQTRDIKFRINRADFVTNTSGTVEFNSLLIDGINAVTVSQFNLIQNFIDSKESDISNEISFDVNDYADIIIGETYKAYSEFDVTALNKLKLFNTLYTTNKYTSPVIDIDGVTILAIHNKINNDITDEDTTDAGSAISRYISREIELNDPADQLNIYLDINRPISTSNISLYVKLKRDSLTYTDWILVPPVTSVPISTDDTEYNEVAYKHISVGDDFIGFLTKLVFTSTNSIDVPSARSLRIIATS